MIGEPTRLLLLEDNLREAKLLQARLDEFNPDAYAIEHAVRLTDALALIASQQFDVVLSDLGLPDSNGLQTVDAITRCAPELPLVVLTGLDDQEIGREAILRGAQDFLTKSESNAALIGHMLCHAIERKRFERALREANQSLAQRVDERTKELRAANQILQASVVRYRAVTQSANDAIITADQNGNIVDWNRGAKSIFGYCADEVIGQPLTILMPPQYRERHLSGFHGLRAGQSPHIIGKTVELEGLRKDQSSFPVELSMANWETEEGWFITGIVRDMTDRKEAQTQLKKSEERFRAMTALSSDWYWEQDDQDRFTHISGSTPVVDILGKTCWELLADLPPEDCLGHRALLDRKLSFQDLEYGIFTKAGEKQWCSINGEPVFDQAGRFAGYRGTGKDITERKKMEAQLRKLAQAVERSPVSIVVTDIDGKIEYTNPRFTQVTGYATEEALGQNPRILQSGETPIETFQELWGALLAHREWRGIFRNRRKNGELFWEEASISPMTNDRGEITHFVAVKEDITERKRAEDVLEQERIRLRTIMQTATDGIHILDRDGMLLLASPAFLNMLGYDESWIGKLKVCDWDALHPWEVIKARNDEMIAQKTRVVFETRHRRRDGVILDVEISASGIEIEGKSYLYAASRDISERKRAEQAMIAARNEAESSARKKMTFLANMSHEIRTPLNGIMGLTELVLNTELTAEQREYLELAHRSEHILHTIIDDVLDFTKVEAGKLELENLNIDLRQILDETLRMLAPSANTKGLGLSLQMADEIPARVASDPSRIKQILVNLVGNAIKFTATGKIVVSVVVETQIESDNM